jgi:hypothetical protein
LSVRSASVGKGFEDLEAYQQARVLRKRVHRTGFYERQE